MMTRQETMEGGGKGKQRWEQPETAGVDREHRACWKTSLARTWTRQPVKKHE